MKITFKWTYKKTCMRLFRFCSRGTSCSRPKNFPTLQSLWDLNWPSNFRALLLAHYPIERNTFFAICNTLSKYRLLQLGSQKHLCPRWNHKWSTVNRRRWPRRSLFPTLLAIIWSHRGNLLNQVCNTPPPLVLVRSWVSHRVEENALGRPFILLHLPLGIIILVLDHSSELRSNHYYYNMTNHSIN